MPRRRRRRRQTGGGLAGAAILAVLAVIVLTSIPPVVWGAIIAAAVALTGTHTVFRLRDRARRRQVASAQAQAAMATGTPMPLGERNTRAIPQDVKVAVAARDGGRCRQCGSTQDLHYDHVIPWSKGGANTVANIQLLCARCNRAKSDR